jgi:PAS domain S-box-containing protein
LTDAASTASRRFLITFALFLAVVVVLVVQAYLTIRELGEANRGSMQTYRVLSATVQMQEGLAEVEAGYRGYALTRAPRYLEQWQAGHTLFTLEAARLRSLVADEPAGGQRLRTGVIERAFADFIRMQRESGVLDPATSRDAAIRAAGDVGGAARRSERVAVVRRELGAVETAESALLRERSARATSLERRTAVLVPAGFFLAIALALATAGMVQRRTRRVHEVNRAMQAEIAEKELARGALLRISRQNELILDAAAEGIYGIDPHGYTLFINPAASEMLGVRPDDVIGRPFEAVLGLGGGARMDHGVNAIRATLSTAAPRAVPDGVFRRADGSSFPVEYASTPMLEAGRVTGAVITFRDVTERREVERMKDEFVSVVSHELRTPLTSIRGSLGLLAAGKLGEMPVKGRRMLEIAVQNTDRLVRLINDILDIERIESGRVTMEVRRVRAAELAHQAVEVMSSMAEKAGVQLYAWADDLPLTVDPDRILQVLTNLLSNAVKFSPPGGEVTVTAEPVGGDVLFRVQDQGRGIPEDRLESIFERFQQVDSSDARDKGGTGLGLAICRSIVQQHGGRIWVESQPGEGSTFFFTLPAPEAGDDVTRDPAATARDAGAPPAAPEPARDPEGPLVLVCDDDPVMLATVEEILQGWGYRTVGVADGESALREAARIRPRAILLDMMMPGMNGSDTLRALRRGPETADIPVVILSAVKPMPRVQEQRDVVEWVEKPFAEQGLLHALEEAVARRARPRRVLVVEDDPDLARLLTDMFGRHGIEAMHAATGVEAVETSRSSPPDMIVLDLALPHGDGFWVVERLRGAGLAGVPLVVYSARDLDEGDRERLRLGHTEFLTKGRLPPEDFERRVVTLLNRIAPARRAEPDEPHPAAG